MQIRWCTVDIWCMEPSSQMPALGCEYREGNFPSSQSQGGGFCLKGQSSLGWVSFFIPECDETFTNVKPWS